MPRRQGRLRRKADDLAADAGPRGGAGGSRNQAHRAGGRAAAQHRALRRSQAALLRQRHDRQGQHGAHHLERQQRLPDAGPARHGAEARRASIGTPCSAGCPRSPGIPSATSTASPIGTSPPAARPAACSCTWWTSSTGSSNMRQPLSAVALGGIYQIQRRPRHARQHQLHRRLPERERHVRSHHHRHDPEGIRRHRLHGLRRAAEHFPLRLQLHLRRRSEGREPRSRRKADRNRRTWATGSIACARRNEPNANVVDGHYGAMACHIGNMAYREKARIKWKKEWDV